MAKAGYVYDSLARSIPWTGEVEAPTQVQFVRPGRVVINLAVHSDSNSCVPLALHTLTDRNSWMGDSYFNSRL